MANFFPDSIASLDRIEGSRLRVLNLDTLNGRTWTSRLLFEFSGASKEDAESGEGRKRLVQAFQDVEFQFASDEEIKERKIISRWRDNSRNARYGEQILMAEVTEPSGLANLPLNDNWKLSKGQASEYWFQFVVEDFNRDGYPDLYIANDFGKNVHLRNRGDGTFEDVTAETETADFATSMGACTGSSSHASNR